MLDKSSGITRQLALRIVTEQVLQIRPSSGDAKYWLFQYIDPADTVIRDDKGEEIFSPDFFTLKAISLAQKVVVRETLGLSLKDILEMDYGTYLHLERIVDGLEQRREEALKALPTGKES